MKCPRTGKPMKQMDFNGVTIDLSEGCGGVWFDQHELKKFDEVHEIDGDVIVSHMKMYKNPLVDEAHRLKCPKCESIIMMRHFYSPKHQIEIDECAKCGGVWLDVGELERIRELFPTQKDRDSAGDDLVQNFLDSSEFKKHEQEFKTSMENMGRIARFLERLAGFVY